MRPILLVFALVLFVVAGLSAADWALDDVNPLAAIAFGLASWVGSLVTPERLG